MILHVSRSQKVGVLRAIRGLPQLGGIRYYNVFMSSNIKRDFI